MTVIAYIFYLRAVGVSKNGTEVVGKVIKLGRAVESMRNVTFSYVAKGKTITKKKSFDLTDVQLLQVGGPIELIVDSRQPKRCYLKASLYW